MSANKVEERGKSLVQEFNSVEKRIDLFQMEMWRTLDR
jgi:hypothetical protein